MTDAALTPDRIVEAAEDVLRRFGPSKATVVDVARALDVSHGSVYRHFASKAALRNAVMKRWLERVSAPLAEIAERDGPAVARLRDWFDALLAHKRRKALDDPELFATYMALGSETGEAVAEHVQMLLTQVAHIIREGIAGGEFSVSDPLASARATLSATSRFHDPAHVAQWRLPGADAAFEEVWDLVLRGLTAPVRLRSGGAVAGGETRRHAPKR